jgi:protease-4
MLYARPLSLLLLSLVTGCAFVNVPLKSPPSPLEEQVLEGTGHRKILLMEVSGTITEDERSGGILEERIPSTVSLVREVLRKAEKDRDIAGVILRINSPGGTVTASDIIHHDITEFRKRTRLPVTASILSVGTSGGYYVAAAADEIVSHPTAITGSIGVILIKFNLEGVMAKVGVEAQTVKSGDKKDILSPFRRATPEEEKLAQVIIDQLHSRFLDTIMARPNNTLTRQDLQKLADGRLFTSGQALEAGLIDRIGYLDDVIAAMRQKAGDVDARIVTYYRPGSYKGSIYAGAGHQSGLFSLFGGMDPFSAGSFMYLWRP